MLSLTFLLYITAVSASCLHGTSFQRRATSDGKVQVATFGYTGEQGPLAWASLSPDNSACSAGTNQSPIVLDDSISKASANPTLNIPNVEEAEFENLGSTLEVIVNGTTTFEGKDYHLKQYHLHTPSEHRIKEEYYPLEMHMVHQADDDSLLVIALMYDLSEDGSTTEILTNSTVNLAEVEEPGSVYHTGPLDFSEITNAVQTKSLYQYTGSLTTPPCKEGITFLVLEEPFMLDVKTYKDLKRIMKFNARYSQNTLGSMNLLGVASSESTCEQAQTAVADNHAPSGLNPVYATAISFGLLFVYGLANVNI